MEDHIIIRKIAGGGWTVSRFKAKGEIVLATLCGGNLGKILAATVAKQAAQIGILDTILLDMGDGTTTTYTEA